MPNFHPLPYLSLKAQRADVHQVKMDWSEINHGMVREVISYIYILVVGLFDR